MKLLPLMKCQIGGAIYDSIFIDELVEHKELIESTMGIPKRIQGKRPIKKRKPNHY